MKTFNLLNPDVRRIVTKRFNEPTPIQKSVIPEVLNGENILVISGTGSGKTESCLLPIFSRWIQTHPKSISVLYISPLRSLNRDLLRRILWWASYLDMDASVRHGDTSQYERSMQAANPPDLLISTPETLQAMLTGKVMRKHMANVKFVVVDEIHELVDNKRGIQLSVGIERLKELIRSAGNTVPQFIGLSATVGTPEKVAEFLTGGKCRIIDTTEAKGFDIMVESPEPTPKDAEQSSDMLVSPQVMARLRRIMDLVGQKRASLIFTNTREFAEILSSRLKALDPDLALDTHHSSLSKDIRVDAESSLKDGKLKALVCTSSLELGIDIGEIDLALQYMSPRQVTKLMQRIGRSGHGVGRISRGIIMASDPDDCFEASVIAGLGIKGRIEPSDVYDQSLDILGHQIVGLSLEEYKIPVKKAYEIVRRSMPFRQLSFEEFTQVCRFMQRIGAVWIDEKYSDVPVIKRRRGAFEYYYRNLSTIPDVKNYRIIDIVTNKPVGSLDAEFIAMHGTPGTSFICKGQAWRILEVKKGSVVVEPEKGIEASIPAWEGELIPVPYEVAQGVGALRREIAEKVRKGGLKAACDHVVSKYPVTLDVARKMARTVKKQLSAWHVPTDREIVIEFAKADEGYWVILHTCFGSLVNETIGRVLTIMLTSRLGSIGLQTDPYRIMLKLQVPRWKDVIDTFRYIEPKSIEGIIDLTMVRTELFTWRFIHVAKRLGIIERDADYGKGYLNKVVDAYVGTPAYTEALHEIKKEKLDIGLTEKLLRSVQKNEVKLVIEPGLSPLAETGLARKYEIVAPDKPEREILEAFRSRILNTKIRLLCTNCGRWAQTGRVSEELELQCPKCGARTIGVTPSWDLQKEKILQKHIAGKKLTAEEEKELDDLMNTGTMVMNYGRPSLKALAGRGVGWTTAKRILNKARDDEELMLLMLEAERKFARTKRFWKA
ncbi:MAG: DEAD/DEAH box helicase [Candidatus Aenigmarchaeota archaeon]|nr:DEAD/DEAH box helicase [Candidatus Aenigmarchaeota archaeon]